MNNLLDGIVRGMAFARKEIFDVIRQPRLLFTMILGPFLILALFGVGYQQSTGPLRTVFVVDDGPFAQQLQDQADDFGDSIEIIGTVTTRTEATQWLRAGTVDVAVIVPEEPIATIREGERATFTVLHDQLDPFEQATISLVARTTVDLVNRRILEQLVASGQEESEDLETILPAARDSAAALREAMERGDTVEAEGRRRELQRHLGQIEQQAGSTEVLIENLRGDFESAESANGVSGRIDSVTGAVASLDLDTRSEPLPEDVEAVRAIEEEVGFLADSLTDFRSVPPEILVSPFGAATDVVGSTQLDIADFYAPGVIALLIQHLGITFGGLSLVRERSLGTPELFRVSPVHPAQILAGKYLGYLGATVVVGVALSVLMFTAFKVPLIGSLGAYAAVLVLLSLASLGLGFVISSVVGSDTQAVNVSLIVLLLSTFFSGFFLSLDRLVQWVRGVSWSLPITHAIDSLRDVMFRGDVIDLRTLVALGGGSVLLFVASLFLLQYRLRAE